MGIRNKPRLAILNQQMWPTRVPVYDLLYQELGDRFKVFYPTLLEGDRDSRWLKSANHPFHLLKSRSISYTLFSLRRYVHFNPDIIPALRHFDPDCVIIYGFYPTALMAWAYTLIRKKKFVVATDGCLKSDRKNLFVHRLLRRLIIPTAVAAVGTSHGSLDLFNQYSNFNERFFYNYLCVDNKWYASYRYSPRKYDVMFAGQFVERKMPFFFVDVVAKMKEKKTDLSAVLIGDGPLRTKTLERLMSIGIQYQYDGFVPNEELAKYYGSARILLFPTKLDAYGIVANEALAVGTPVISNDEPGAAGEVILHNRTGYVLPLDDKIWAEHALRLLGDQELYERISEAGFDHIQKYSLQSSVQGLLDVFEYAMNH